MNGNRPKGPSLLGALVSRLGFVETGVSRRGPEEIRLYQGFGLTVRQTRKLPHVDAALNGHEAATEIASLSNLAYQLEVAEPPPPPRAEARGPNGAAMSTAAAQGQDRQATAVVLTKADQGPAATELAPEPSPVSRPELPVDNVAEALLPAGERHAILAGKTVGIVGFAPEDSVSFGKALAAQYCSFTMLSHEEAEFRKGSTAGCDLLVVAAKREWGQAGALYPGSLFQTKRPALIIGERDVLAAVALWIHGGPREFIPAPWTVEDAIWRSAVVLSRLPASKTRKGKKNARRRVIIGDSDTSVSALLHAFLAQEGMECHVAENGVAALALAKAKEADAVIVDVSLPGLDGFQILAEIKRDPALHQAAVILLTARQTEADVLRGFGLGADDYLTKPFSPMEVAARLKRCFLRKP